MPPLQHHFLVEGPGGINVVRQANAYYSKLPVYAPIFDTGGAVYSVKAFGALGDGKTDDSTAFNTALTTATLLGGTVMIPNSPTAYRLNPTTLNAITANFIGQSMAGVVLKLVDQYNATNDMIRVVSQSGLMVGNFTIDGNKGNQSSGTVYGLYVSTTTNCSIMNVIGQNCSGVGIHFYNNNRASALNLWGTNNTYHGLEFEQNSRGTYTNIHGFSNTLHGVLVDPGEVGGTGSHGNCFTNVECDGNSQYGLAFNAANGDVSAWLSEGDTFNNVSLTNNTQYGLNIYKQDKQTFNGLYIYNNGFFGIYLFESQYNTFNGIFLHNNSQVGAGSYDEILVEGYSTNSAHPSLGNVFNGGQIVIDGTTKARYCFNEGTANDGPNTFVNINTPHAGTSGTVHQVCPSDIISSPGGVVMIGDNSQAIPGANAGFDSAFSHVLRLYNNFTSGSTQIVTPNGNTSIWAGGNQVLAANSTNVTLLAGIITNLVTKATSYNILTSDHMILMNSTGGVVTATLPTAVGVTGQEYIIKDWKGTAATHAITVATTSSQTIDGATSIVMASNYEAVHVVSDGANWSVVGEVSTSIL